MKNKFNILILVLFIIMFVVSVSNVIKKNSLANENNNLKTKIETLEQNESTETTEENNDTDNNNNDTENENNNNENTDEENKESASDENENTFEEDIEWFLNNVYTENNQKNQYEKVKDSITDSMTESMYGNDLPPEDSDDEDGVDNDIEGLEVYGKYTSDNEYTALVKFDLVTIYEDKEDKGERIVEIHILKEDDIWLFDSMDEHIKGGAN